MKRILKISGFTLLTLFIIIIIGFVIWAKTPLGPMPEALASLESDNQVTVDSNRWLEFKPNTITPEIGLVIYPGGRVDARSYAPMAHTIAAKGYLVVITPMPLNLAVFSPARAQSVIDAHPEITHWAIAGHSLGGAMAANFVYNHPYLLQGLVLWAAYPASNNDLSSYAIPVISIYGTQDGLATTTLLTTRYLLPPSTQFILIEGGNHSQFGWYGDQPGDHPASITRQDEQSQIIDATLSFLAGIMR